MIRGVAAALALALSLTAAAAAERVLLTPTRVEGIAADGATSVVSIGWAPRPGACERVLAWNAVRPTRRALGPRRRCPRVSRNGMGRAVLYQAIAGQRAAWVQLVGHDQREARLFTTTLANAKSAKRIALPRGDYVGNVHGDGSLLVFGTWSLCGQPPLAPCPAGVQRWSIVDARVWRLEGVRKRLVARAPRELSPLGVSAGRILLQRADGSLATLSPAGRTLAVFDPAPAWVMDAAIGGRDVAVLVRSPGTSPDSLFPT